MNDKPKRRLTEFDRWNIARLNHLKFWAKKWRENPQAQEKNRQLGVQASKDKRQSRNERLREIISTWPAKMTPDELRDRISGIFPAHYNPRSATNRIVRLGLMSFDRPRHQWVNNTTNIPTPCIGDKERA
jgi:hypothetical protein